VKLYVSKLKLTHKKQWIIKNLILMDAISDRFASLIINLWFISRHSQYLRMH